MDAIQDINLQVFFDPESVEFGDGEVRITTTLTTSFKGDGVHAIAKEIRHKLTADTVHTVLAESFAGSLAELFGDGFIGDHGAGRIDT